MSIVLSRPQRAVVALLAFLAVSASPAAGAPRVDSPDAAEAKRILAGAEYTGGLIVHLGCGDGRLTAALYAGNGSVVHGLDSDPAQVAGAREHIHGLGLCGKVSVDRFDGKTLPYADHLVNLIVLHEAGADRDGAGVSREEIMRVLAPGGVSCSREGPAAELRIARKAWPEEMDHWTHFLHSATGNAVAADQRVAPATALQWIVEPKYCRSHEIDSSLPAMVSADGRLFYILDEGPIGITDQRFPARWVLIARDAFNGVLLWKRPLKPWGWQEWKPEIRTADWRTLRGQRGRFPAEVPRRLVAVGDRVYVTLGFHDAPISILDAATGNVITHCQGTEGTQEIIVADDTVLARVRPSQADEATRRGEKISTRLMALDATTGKTRWSQDVGSINRLSLAADGDAVVFQRGPTLLCYDRQGGQLRWKVETPGGGIVVIHKDVVLISGKGGANAFSLADGKHLWQGSGTGRDLLVIRDLVWRVQLTSGILEQRQEHWPTLSRQAGARLLGYDFRTGELRRTIDVANAVSPGHHLRCYRSKATDRFIIYPKRGAEFLDLQGNDHMRHDWLRGSCSYGILPCNGLLYTPPDQCFCYIGSKIDGLAATSGADTTAMLDPRSPGRLVRGPAYGSPLAAPAAAADWPTYRADAKRSGSNRQAKVSRELHKQWEIALGGKLTQPTIAAGKVFVAAVDRQTVYGLDTATGEQLWKFVAGGRIDSSPTYHSGLLLFGANDGSVYCLDASSGELVWRFRAAPNERRIVAFGQVESPWPVHGTVLVMNSLAYVAAGRSTLIDGGAHLYALEPQSGNVVHYTHVEQPQPDLSKDIGEHFAMDGSNIDVLTTDGKHVFCAQEMFDAELNRIETKWNTRYGDRYLGEDHLIATGGMLDDTGFNRIFWSHGNRWPGFYFLLMAPKSGNLLVFDAEKTWATKWFVERNIHSPLFFPQTTGYLLFCDKNTTRPFLVGDPDAPEPIQWLPDTLMKPYKYDGHSITNRHDNFTIETDKGSGFTRGTPTVWQQYLPVRIEAMALTSDTLFAAGPPDVLDPDDPLGALEGRQGGVLLAIDPATGQQLSQTRVPWAPRFDGMSAAGSRLFLVTGDGRLVAWQ
ncbi:MAG: PQQ-binding-like beta-propeller repeat protein [Planctomycetes bacterium]|nr:PQQ-binding-like beta-propeller repeat protein [Planctomycetota bacterium]